MKNLVIIIIFSFLTAFQVDQKEALGHFAKTQLTDFKIIQTLKTGYFVNSIENYGLHIKKTELAIKAKKPHSSKDSYNQNVYSFIQMWQFDFETKEKCKQVQDSLLSCFPNDCFKVQRQVDRVMKITPAIFIFNDKQIIIAQTLCEHVDQKWFDFKRKFAKAFAENNADLIVTECGKLTWKAKQDVITAP